MNSHKRLIILVAAVAGLWLGAVGGSLGWNFYNEKRQMIEQARRAALVALDKDTAFRQWVRSHGGVYVPTDERTPPNARIAHVPNRDIVVGAQPYTLMNSSYATRQIMEEAGERTGLMSRVTSLDPLRPENKPDAWEEKALLDFEASRSRSDFFETIRLQGREQLRGIRPFYVEASCLKCHAHQGYGVGDLRGAIAVRVDLESFFAHGDSIVKTLAATHAIFALLGLTGIGWLYREGARNLRNEESLARMNRNLEERVLEETQRRREQEQMLIQQSKMASMGEMLGAIAHQWRQPLNTLSVTLQDMADAHIHGELDRNYIDTAVARAARQIDYMSQTIDDFRNFFRPDTRHHSFDAAQAVKDVLSLLSSQFKSNNIALRLSLPESGISVRGFSNQFKQALLNIVTNAKDAIAQNRAAGGEIEVVMERVGEHGCRLSICDNGGGIAPEAMARIFEPYFTTKDAKHGTGIGLYMARFIVEENMNGTLRAQNRGAGACFIVELNA